MKPYVICHMNASVDGRILGSRWRPAENRMAGLFERLHAQLGGGSWLIGRVTGSEYAKAEAYPDHTDETYPREPWFTRRDVAAYGIALDAQGKIAWGRSDIGGDPIVVVLTERISDAHLAGLRQDGVSYIFAGEQELDLGLLLEILNRELGLERLLLEGGGASNGAFLRAGLIDEISLAICPAVDGANGAPSILDSSDRDAGIAAPITSMTWRAPRCWRAAWFGSAIGSKTADARQGTPAVAGPRLSLPRRPPGTDGPPWPAAGVRYRLLSARCRRGEGTVGCAKRSSADP